MGMKHWNVRVLRDGKAVYLGQVAEASETLARCAALSRFGLSEDELEAGAICPRGMAIYPDEDFAVSPAG